LLCLINNSHFDNFIEKCVKSGIKGIIIPDLPFEEAHEISKKLKKNNIFYKSKDLWIVFMLFVLSFYASSTNFSLKLVDNYTLSIYINQFMMFLLSIIFFYKIIKKQD